MTYARTSKTLPSLLRDAFIYRYTKNILQNLIFAAYVKTYENVSLVPRGFFPDTFPAAPPIPQK